LYGKKVTNFYNIAQGSSDELRYYVVLAKDLGFLDKDDEKIGLELDEVGRMLNGLITSMGSRS
jgi:four helix bundle protein